jgi:hypothetical protein
MVSAGLGLSPRCVDWKSALRALAIDDSEDSSLATATRRLVEWAFDIEVAGSDDPSPEEAEFTLDSLLAGVDDLAGLDMNQWAYFMLRLGMFRAANPLAKRALAIAGKLEFLPNSTRANATKDAERYKEAQRYSVAMCQDTYAWALCYEGNFGEAKALLEDALTYFSNRAEWYEVQFHRAHAAFWSGEHKVARQIISAMRNSGGDDIWTKKAEHLIESANAPWSTQAQSWHSKMFGGFKAARKSSEYDAVISFAGEDRPYASDLAKRLQAAGLSVFYDDFERAALLGQNLYEYLSDVFQNKGRYSVVLISKHYVRKRWTQFEWRAIQARCFREQGPYCLPIRIDGSDLPGLQPAVAYLSTSKLSIADIAEVLVRKLKTTP